MVVYCRDEMPTLSTYWVLTSRVRQKEWSIFRISHFGLQPSAFSCKEFRALCPLFSTGTGIAYREWGCTESGTRIRTLRECNSLPSNPHWQKCLISIPPVFPWLLFLAYLRCRRTLVTTTITPSIVATCKPQYPSKDVPIVLMRCVLAFVEYLVH